MRVRSKKYQNPLISAPSPSPVNYTRRLSERETEVQITPIALNASRLLADAELLFVNERYPTATSLAILAIEESGKFLDLRRRQKDKSQPNLQRLHLKKQAEALRWVLVEQAIRTFFEVLGDHGLEHLPCAAVSEEQRVWRNSAEGQAFSQRLQNPPDWIMSAVHARMIASGLYAVVQRVDTGEINHLKQQGFYVDIHTDMVATRPQAIDAHEASKWLDLGKKAVALTELYVGSSSDSEAFLTVPRMPATFVAPF